MYTNRYSTRYGQRGGEIQRRLRGGNQRKSTAPGAARLSANAEIGFRSAEQDIKKLKKLAKSTSQKMRRIAESQLHWYDEASQ